MDRGDTAVLQQIEGLFRDTESFFIAAFQVLKASRTSEATGAQLLRALGGQALQRDGLKPRVLALTVKRSLTDRGFRGSLHICKLAEKGSGLQVRRSYPLKCLHDIRALHRKGQAAGQAAADAGGHEEDQQQNWVELRFASHHEVPEHMGCYLLPSSQQLLFLMSLVTQVLRQQDDVLPTLLGITQDKLDSWWKAHKDFVTSALPPFALEVITPGVVQVGRKDTSSVLISEKEEADLEELLDMFAMGLGDLDTFNARLQEEQSALEAANVFAILQNTGQVDHVMLQLKRTQVILDDLDESLKVFDFKLRHMRDDIAAIEASNNTLERQGRHNAALLSTIRNLQGGLGLHPDVARVLESPNFDGPRLKTLVRSAWLLVDKLNWLNGAAAASGTTQEGNGGSSGGAGSAKPLNPLLQRMLVVREARERLEQVAGRFIGKAARHLQELITRCSQEVMADWSRATSRSYRLVPPNRAQLRATLLQYRDLLAVLVALDPHSLAGLQQHYASTFNTLLRRELRGCSSELRKGVQADLGSSSGASGDGDYTLLKERSSSKSRVSTGSGGYGSDAASDVGDVEAWQLPRSPLGRLGGRGAELSTRRHLFLQGSSGGLPLHEAWQHLMETWMPFLADEASFAAHWLHMHKGDDRPQRPPPDDVRPSSGGRMLDTRKSSAGGSQPSSPRAASERDVREWRGPSERALTKAGTAAINGMLAGLDEDFRTLLDTAGRSHQAQAIPCLALARIWARRMAASPSSGPLTDILARCCEQLLSSFHAWVGAQVTAVEAYDSKSKMGLQQGIKNVHVLSYVSQFCLLAHDIEVLLAGVSPGSSLSTSTEGDPVPPSDPAAAEALASVRADVQAVYSRLLGIIFARLDAQAASDPKYSERLKLENTSYLSAALGPLGKQDAVLLEAAQAAEARRESSLRSYVQSQLEYGKLWKLLEFAEKLDKLLQVVSPPEVAFQKDCSAAEVRGLIRSTMEGADKKLEVMAQRVVKHLGTGKLARSVWGRLQADLLHRYEHLEQLLERCYPTLPLRPSPEELKELFKATSFGQ